MASRFNSLQLSHLKVDGLQVPGLLDETPRLLQELMSHGAQFLLIHLDHALQNKQDKSRI